MTDRIKGFVVTLEQDMRDDDVQSVVDAIGMIRGVASCSPSVADIDDHMNRTRIRLEMRAKVLKALELP